MSTRFQWSPLRRLAANRLRLRLLVIVAIGCAAVAIGAASANNSDTAGIYDVTRGAIVAQMTLETPPSDYSGGRLTSDQYGRMGQAIDETLSRYYLPGPTKDRFSAALHAAVAADVDGQNRYLSGGVDWVQLESVAISGDSAAAVLLASAWNRQGDATGNVIAQPRTVSRYTFSLRRPTAGWRISSELRDYVSGDRP